MFWLGDSLGPHLGALIKKKPKNSGVLPGHVSGSSYGQAGVARTVISLALLHSELTVEDIYTIVSKQCRNYLFIKTKKNPTRQELPFFI